MLPCSVAKDLLVYANMTAALLVLFRNALHRHGAGQPATFFQLLIVRYWRAGLKIDWQDKSFARAVR